MLSNQSQSFEKFLSEIGAVALSAMLPSRQISEIIKTCHLKGSISDFLIVKRQPHLLWLFLN